MDVEELKTYYTKPSNNVNKHSIDFILGYKHDDSKTETDSQTRHGDDSDDEVDGHSKTDTRRTQGKTRIPFTGSQAA